MSGARVQQRIFHLLKQKLDERITPVEKEWNVTKNSKDDYIKKHIYAPRVDIAVGPFMVNYLTSDEFAKMRAASVHARGIIDEIVKTGKTIGEEDTVSDFVFNENPRCLIAIEVEASGTRKHMIGDIANAAILGKIGIIAPVGLEKYKAFERIFEYLKFAQRNDKINSKVFKNVVLIRAEELISLLNR